MPEHTKADRQRHAAALRREIVRLEKDLHHNGLREMAGRRSLSWQRRCQWVQQIEARINELKAELEEVSTCTPS